MAGNSRETSPRDKGGAGRILSPLPAFIIVTTLTALSLGVPSFQELLEGFTASSYGKTSLILHLLIPPATGLLAALGVYLGFTDRAPAAHGPSAQASRSGVMSTDERARAILRNLPISVVTISAHRQVTFSNPAALATFAGEGNSRRHPFLEFLEVAGLGSFLDQVFDGVAAIAEEVPFRPLNEMLMRILRINGVPILRNDRVVEAMLLVEDITDWKALEEDLIRSEERYRNIFNHAACGIFFVDKNGNYLDANPAALEMLGYSMEELLKLNTRELSSDSEQRIRKLKETPGWVVEETRYLRKDGTIVEAELSSSSFHSGDDTYFIGIAKDITARKNLERQLTAAQSTLSTIINRDSEAIVLCDRSGEIWKVNGAAADLLGIPAERCEGLVLLQGSNGQPADLRQMPPNEELILSISPSTGSSMEITAIMLPGDADNQFFILILKS